MSLENASELSAVVQGASRGIGLALVEELLTLPGVNKVYACCRHPESAENLKILSEKQADRLEIVKIELEDESTMQDFANRLKQEKQKLKLLINVSGLLHDAKKGIKPEKKIEDLELDAMRAIFEINTFSPFLLIKHLFPLFKHTEPSVIANISAKVGSISDNRLGGWYSYRASKAAQNMLTKNLSIELSRRSKNTIAVAIHPGTVDTLLSKPFQGGVPAEKLFSVQRAARQIITKLLKLELDDNGKFFSWDGSELPW